MPFFPKIQPLMPGTLKGFFHVKVIKRAYTVPFSPKSGIVNPDEEKKNRKQFREEQTITYLARDNLF
jgi:hypothetical protein